MVHDGTVTLTQNRRWAWGGLGLTLMIVTITLYDAYVRAALTWPALVLGGGLTAVMIWVTWPILPDWRLDRQGIYQGQVLIIRWHDVDRVDVRTSVHALGHPGSVDVDFHTVDTVVRLRMYCRVEAQQVMQVLGQYVPERCDRTPMVNAVDRVWSKQRRV